MPFGLLKSAVGAISGAVSSFAGSAISSIVPQITSIAPSLAGFQLPSMSSIAGNLVNQGMGYVTNRAMGMVNNAIGGVVGRVGGAVGNVIGGVNSVLSGVPLNFSNLTNTISNITSSNIVGDLLGGNYVGETNDRLRNQFKSLVKKSAYNFSKFSEQAVLDKVNNPFQYETAYYPEEVASLGDGHYITFDILENAGQGEGIMKQSAEEFDVTSFERDNTSTNRRSRIEIPEEMKYGYSRRLPSMVNRTQSQYNSVTSNGTISKGETRIRDRTVRKMMSGARTGQDTGKRSGKTISQTIVLGMPNQNHQFNYKSTFSGPESTGMSEALIKAIGNLIGGRFGQLGDSLKNLGVEGIERIKRGAIASLIPGGAVLQNISSGFAMNPKMEIAFESVPFREFTFDFDMMPRNAFENSEIHKIIKLFKFHMLPSRGTSGQLFTPSEFQITYCYRENENMYIPLISRCAMTSFNVDYAPESQFNTFHPDEIGAPPLNVKMSMSFTELEIMTKETIAASH